MTIRVIISGHLKKAEERDLFEATFEEVSRTLLKSTLGIISDELVRDARDPMTYLLLSEWEDREQLAAWQATNIHEKPLASILRYWTGQTLQVGEEVYHLAKETFDVNREESTHDNTHRADQSL